MARDKRAIIQKIKDEPEQHLRLLDDDDLNLGGVVTISPNPDPGLGVPERILDVQCPGRHGEFTTVSFNVLPNNNDINDRVNYSGPLVGIIEFGNGSAINRVEIDIPNGNNTTSASLAFYPSSWLAIAGSVPSGGASISVPGSSVRVYARHDGNGRVWDPNNPISLNLNPMKVQAHISYGRRVAADSRLYRTLMSSNFAGSVPTNTNNFIGIPPYSKSLIVYRPGLEAMTITLRSRQLDGSIAPLPGVPIAVYHIAAGVNSPNIPLSGLADIVGVLMDAPNSGPSFCVFSIGL